MFHVNFAFDFRSHVAPMHFEIKNVNLYDFSIDFFTILIQDAIFFWIIFDNYSKLFLTTRQMCSYLRG